MRKLEELQKGCMAKAKDDEMTFVLLGRDKSAPVAIRAWIGDRLRTGKNVPTDRKIVEAEQCAATMERESEEPLVPVNIGTIISRRSCAPCGCDWRSMAIERAFRILFPTVWTDCKCKSCNATWTERFEFDFSIPSNCSTYEQQTYAKG